MLPVSLIFINSGPLSDPRKSKAQTTHVQEPRPCLQIPFAEINYFPDARTDERTKDGHQFFFTTGWKERFAQQYVFAFVTGEGETTMRDLLLVFTERNL